MSLPEFPPPFWSLRGNDKHRPSHKNVCMDWLPHHHKRKHNLKSHTQANNLKAKSVSTRQHSTTAPCHFCMGMQVMASSQGNISPSPSTKVSTLQVCSHSHCVANTCFQDNKMTHIWTPFKVQCNLGSQSDNAWKESSRSFVPGRVQNWCKILCHWYFWISKLLFDIWGKNKCENNKGAYQRRGRSVRTARL